MNTFQIVMLLISGLLILSVFWEKLSNTAFKHMFQIKSIAEIDLSQELFNELVGWSEKKVCRMFTHMKYPRSYQVLNHIKNNH